MDGVASSLLILCWCARCLNHCTSYLKMPVIRKIQVQSYEIVYLSTAVKDYVMLMAIVAAWLRHSSVTRHQTPKSIKPSVNYLEIDQIKYATVCMNNHQDHLPFNSCRMLSTKFLMGSWSRQLVDLLALKANKTFLCIWDPFACLHVWKNNCIICD